MRFAEVFLRLGTSLVAWMVLYAHFLWLAVVYVIGCGPDGDEMYGLLLGLAPLTCGSAFLLRVTRPFADIHSIMRWLGVPLLLLLPFAVRSIWPVFQSASLDATAICGDGSPTTWQTLWAPTQLVTILVVAYCIVQVWRNVRIDAVVDRPTDLSP